jgi:hypothetical protein
MRSLPDDLRRRIAEPLPGLAAQLRMAPDPRTWPDEGAPLRPAAALLLIYPYAGECMCRSLFEDPPYVITPVRCRCRVGASIVRMNPLNKLPCAKPRRRIGVTPTTVEIIGRLTPVPIAVSGHLLYPIVGIAQQRPAFSIAASEVERLIELPVARLMAGDAVASERRVRPLPAARRSGHPLF